MALPQGQMRKFNFNVTDTPFMMFQAHPNDYHKIIQESVKEIQSENTLSKVFFHRKNINLIQKKIIKQVLKKSNNKYLIEKQNEEDLLVVMKSIFLRFAKHSPRDIKNQINELDNLVVDAVTPEIISQINAYVNYMKVIYGPNEVMDLPKYVSNAGRRS